MRPSLDVVKWGGENASLLRDNAEIQSENPEKRIIAVSAMRSDEFNTTSKFLDIAVLLSSRIEGYEQEALRGLQEIEDFHLTLLSEQGSKDDILSTCKNIFSWIRDVIIAHIKTDPMKRGKPSESNDYTITYREGGDIKKLSLAGVGEFISARLNTLYMQSHLPQGVDILGDFPNREVPFYENTQRIAEAVNKSLESSDIVFAPGYIVGTGGNIMTTIGRGFTDATASLIALSLKEVGYDATLCIEKMVDGFMSTDPRILRGTDQKARLIRELNYLIAKEIITEKGPEAKLLHAKSLDRRIQGAQIPVRVYNPFSESPGTTIDAIAANMPQGIFYVGGVEDIDALVYSSGRMEEGFVGDTNMALAETGVNVKEILGSGTEHTSVFSRTDTDIETMRRSMQEKYDLNASEAGEFVEHRTGLSLVYCVGNMKDVIGTLAELTACLRENDINVKGFTQGLEQRAMAIVVQRSDYRKAILALHDRFIDSKAT